MENSQIVAELASNLIEVSARNTASYIANKIRTSKAKKNDKETINELEEIIGKMTLSSEVHGLTNEGTHLEMLNFGPRFKIMINGYDRFFDEKSRKGLAETLFWKISNLVADNDWKYTDPRTFHLKLGEYLAQKKDAKRIARGKELNLRFPLYVDTKSLNPVEAGYVLNDFMTELRDKGKVMDALEYEALKASEEIEEPSVSRR